MSAHPIEPAPAMTPEQRLADVLATALTMPDGDLASLALEIDDHIESRTKALRRELETARAHKALIYGELQRRITLAGGTMLADDEIEIALEQKTELKKDIATLRLLADMLPADEFAKAVYLEAQEPVWKADARKLTVAAKRYGGNVAHVIDEGLRHVAIGAPKLVLRRKQKRVAQIEGAK